MFEAINQAKAAAMSDLQRSWAKSKLGLTPEPFTQVEEEDEQNGDQVAELPEHVDDDSSSASSVSSTGTIIPTPSQRLFARPQGYVSFLFCFPRQWFGQVSLHSLCHGRCPLLTPCSQGCPGQNSRANTLDDLF